MYSNEQIADAKVRLPIVQYLADKGIMPVKQSGGQYLYFSPFREEKTPSFWVEPNENVWCDFAEDHGDLIRLVSRLEKKDFPATMQFIFQAKIHEVEVTFQAPDLPSNPQRQHVIQRITEVKDYRLLNYAKGRGISTKVLNRFCREIRYETHKGTFSSIGFKSQSGGWELRSSGFKGCLGKKDITVLGKADSTDIVVFEGFFDFLSYMEMFTDKHLDVTAYTVLNSLSFLPRVQADILPDYHNIALYLDNDREGQKAAEYIRQIFPNRVIDISKEYLLPHKDLNEYLVAQNRAR